MDLSTLLWMIWFVFAAGGFYLLEKRGIYSTHDRWWSLTNRIRLLQRTHPVVRAAIYGGMLALATFLVAHFAVDPLIDPGA